MFNDLELANILAVYSELDLEGRLGPAELAVLGKVVSLMLPSSLPIWQETYILDISALEWGKRLMPVN